jgi:hypothetical protein
MLPYVEVSHLPSSASFYAAVTHPLGLRYISADPASIVYGTTSPNDPAATTTTSTTLAVFEVRHLTGDRAGQLRPSRLVLSASSPSVVSAFHAAALRANPDLPLIGGSSGESHFLRHQPPSPAGGGEESRAKLTDFDGNIMEVVYLPPQNYASRHGGSTVRRTQSTTDEVSRILDWNLDVATSHPAKSAAGSGAVGGSATALARRPAPMPFDDPHPPPTVLRRSVTTSTLETSSSPRHHSNALSPGAVVGTVLGAVAAGAAIGGALTYMSMRNDRERAPRQEFDAPPAFQRRSTFPDPYPGLKPRYIEVERTVEKIHYPQEYPPIVKSRYYPPPSHIARYSLGGSRSREVEEIDDRASRHSARQSTSGRTRTRSEATSTRRPMMIADTEYMSNSGSKYTTAPAPKMLMETEHRSRAGSKHSTNMLPEADHWSRAPSKHSTSRSVRHHEPAAETYVSVPRSARHYEPEAQSYASARSKRSDATIRPPPPPLTYEETAMRSRASSKVPTPALSRHSTTSKMMPSMSRTASHASARMVPLPDSRVGSSHANWDDDHDNDSIAPSDSISCIGSRSRVSRSYH